MLLDRRPPREDERVRALAGKLRDRIRRLPPLADEKSVYAWHRNRIELRKDCLESDPRYFANWNVIRRTMFVGNSPYIGRELQAVQHSPDWASRWKGALIEDAMGAPERSKFWRASSGNRIHHGYSLYQLEERSGAKVGDLRQIVEFGGGYGSLCRLAHRLGFRGRYIIFDFPEFLALQEYYLTSLDIPFSLGVSGSDARCVYGVSSLDDLRRTIMDESDGCLIALWTLSECSIAMRNDVLNAVAGFDYHLIALQESFEGIDNLSFFRTMTARRNKLSWQLHEIPHLPENFYLIGQR